MLLLLYYSTKGSTSFVVAWVTAIGASPPSAPSKPCFTSNIDLHNLQPLNPSIFSTSNLATYIFMIRF
ncbi:hypothetical protein CDL15_Pgr011948 [Punica granatum]|uniref:Uncharacterized protein n=1 Tax=Punica granatum TaxID=22663 RepID=A0A218WEK2_PUNGR|nr:hypothetical protein CDL15_Pgr011948 [Punica granatum]